MAAVLCNNTIIQSVASHPEQLKSNGDCYGYCYKLFTTIVEITSRK